MLQLEKHTVFKGTHQVDKNKMNDQIKKTKTTSFIIQKHTNIDRSKKSMDNQIFSSKKKKK